MRWLVAIMVLVVSCVSATESDDSQEAGPATAASAPPPATAPEPPTAATAATTPTPAASSLEGRFEAAGTELFIRCRGDGSPTVLFEAGYGTSSSDWLDIMAEVGQRTRACAYDRSGLGRSPAVDSTVADGAFPTRSLIELLAVADISGPFVIVGHSVGGLLALLFAADHPDVVGVVLVDSSHPDQQRVLEAVLGEVPVPRGLESLDVLAVVARAAEVSLGDIPLIVISAGRPPSPPPGFTEDQARELHGEFARLHEDLTRLSSDSVRIIAEDSGHMIHRSEPAVVVQAIDDLIGG